MNIEQLKPLLPHAKKAAELLKFLSHPGRLVICCALSEDELNPTQLAYLTDMSMPALSPHLKSLEKAEILKVRQDHRNRYYKLKSKDVMKIIQTLQSIYCPEMVKSK